MSSHTVVATAGPVLDAAALEASMIEAVTSKPPLAPSGGSPASNGDGSSGKRRRGPRKKKKGGKSGKAGGAAGAEPGAAAGGAGGEVAGNSPTKGASAAEKAAQPTVRDALEDLSARFLLNLPAGEETVSRVFSQVQQAHWFYEDHYADNYDHLPHLSGSEFTQLLFRTCPALRPHRSRAAELRGLFKTYLGQIPVCGAVLLNAKCSHMLLVRNWKGSSWGFPRGKVNEGESAVDCAIREVYEEVGFDCSALIREEHSIEVRVKEQDARLFVVKGVPDDFAFETQTRKEVSAIAWFPVYNLIGYVLGKGNSSVAAIVDPVGSGKTLSPSRFWGVKPYLGPLRQWLAVNGKGKRGRKRKHKKGEAPPAVVQASSGAPSGRRDADTFGTDASGGWSADAMFKVNEKLLGRKFTYDGSSHGFGVTDGDTATETDGGTGRESEAEDPVRKLIQMLHASGGAALSDTDGGTTSAAAHDDHSGSADQRGSRRRGPRRKKGGGGRGQSGRASDVETFGRSDGGWSVDEMFKTNEKLLGKTFTYDGSSHGFGVVDDATRAAPVAPPAPRIAAAHAPPAPAAPSPAAGAGAFSFDTDSIMSALTQHMLPAT